jgi:hypothetical protein
LLWTVLAYSAGILFSKYATTSERWTPPNWELIAAVIVLFAAVFWLRKRPFIAAVVALLALSLLGAAQYQLQSPISVAQLPATLENQQVTITGYVTRASIPVLESGNSSSDSEKTETESHQQLDLQVQQIEVDDRSERLPIGVRVGIYEREAANDRPTEFAYGQILRVHGRIHSPQVYGDPGVFDRREYLAGGAALQRF